MEVVQMIAVLRKKARSRGAIRRRRAGVTVLEVTLALAVAGMATAIALMASQDNADRLKARIAGAQFAAVTAAAERHLIAHYDDVLERLPDSRAPWLMDSDKVDTDGNVVEPANGVSIDELIEAGALPRNWSTTGPDMSPYGHDYQIWVRRVAPGAEETLGFEAMVMALGDTAAPTPTYELALAARHAGGNAGYRDGGTLGKPAGVIRGLYGRWKAEVDKEKYRDVGGRPVELAALLPIATQTRCGRDFYRVPVPGCDESSSAEETIIFGNDLDPQGKVSQDAIGVHVRRGPTDPTEDRYRAVFGRTKGDAATFQLGDKDSGGRLIVEGYAEVIDDLGDGNVVLPQTREGNVFRVVVNGSTGKTTVTLPPYNLIGERGEPECGPGVPRFVDLHDTATSVTVIVRLTGLQNDRELEFRTREERRRTTGCPGYSGAKRAPGIEWGFGGEVPPICKEVGTHWMVYQFVRFRQQDPWTGALTYQTCKD